MLNSIHIRTLNMVLTTGSFAKAGSMLGYSASAVSQQISALESSTGLTLFERGARSVRPTRAAIVLGERCAGVLDQLTALEQEARALAAGDRGVVRVGSYPAAQATLIPWALARLAQWHPDAQVDLEEGESSDLMPLVLSSALDLALVYVYDLMSEEWPAGITAVELMQERLFVLVPPANPFVTADRVRLGDLAGQRWITGHEGSAKAALLTRLCADAGFSPRVAFRSNNHDAVQEMVRAGLGVALVPDLALAGPSRETARALDGMPCVRRVFAVRRTSTTNALLTSFEAALSRAAADRRMRQRPTAQVR
ncbi:LysR family transcriptional regulator [Kitasatospora sp. NPDC089509]|uniref:LysR family transcriptional regulator n=1 Tax=Kitasatospora sp. NPDC089509 TaxID=3364079 RepID=UPI0038198C8D